MQGNGPGSRETRGGRRVTAGDPAVTARLSDEGRARLQAAEQGAAALRALDALAALIDPDGTRRRWATAGRLAAMLGRFEATAWRNIQRGIRSPRNEVEELLTTICASSLPRTRDRLHKLLN